MKNLPVRFWLVLIVFILAATLACTLTSNIPSLAEKKGTSAPSTSEPNSTELPTKPGTKHTPTKIPTIYKQTTTSGAAGTQSATSLPDGTQSASQDINPNLASLNNYRISLKITAQGKNDQGVAINEIFSSLEEVNKPASSTHVNNSDEVVTDTTDKTITDIYVIGNQVYNVDNSSDQPSCTVYGTGDETIEGLGGIRPGQMFIGVEKDTLISSGETQNGIKTDHYSAKNINMSLGDPTSIKGEIWIAQDGKYIVRFNGSASGNFLLNSNLINGSVTWDYNLTDINQVGDMQAPSACSDTSGTISTKDFPIPDNATDKQILGDFIAFESPDNADVVLAYYRKQLPDKGWTINSDTEADGAFIIDITKGSSSLEITVIPEDPSGSSVVVNTAS